MSGVNIIIAAPGEWHWHKCAGPTTHATITVAQCDCTHEYTRRTWAYYYFSADVTTVHRVLCTPFPSKPLSGGPGVAAIAQPGDPKFDWPAWLDPSTLSVRIQEASAAFKSSAAKTTASLVDRARRRYRTFKSRSTPCNQLTCGWPSSNGPQPAGDFELDATPDQYPTSFTYIPFRNEETSEVKTTPASSADCDTQESKRGADPRVVHPEAGGLVLTNCGDTSWSAPAVPTTESKLTVTAESEGVAFFGLSTEGKEALRSFAEAQQLHAIAISMLERVLTDSHASH